MALALPRTVSSDCENPALVFYVFKNGFLKDPNLLEFQVFDVSTPTKLSNYQIDPDTAQVFPLVAGTRETVDLTSCTTGGDRLGIGRFVAQYTPAVAEPTGRHLIKWYLVREAGGTEEVFTQEFEVLEVSEPVPDSYALMSDMRAEGIKSDFADDARVLMALRQSRRYIERITGRFFEPRFMEIKVDGKSGSKVMFDMPIIALETVLIDDFPVDPSETLLNEESIRVYNRHIEQRLEQPDDRNNPLIEALGFFHSGLRNSSDDFTEFAHHTRQQFIFPRGQQNVTLRGVFGYTEWDGSSAGSTPFEIRHVSKLLALRELPGLLDIEQREEFQQRFRVTREKTKQQQIDYIDRPSGRGQGVFFGYFTGDPQIDNILAAYVRPPAMGAA